MHPRLCETSRAAAFVHKLFTFIDLSRTCRAWRCIRSAGYGSCIDERRIGQAAANITLAQQMVELRWQRLGGRARTSGYC
eukprot:1781155-Pleurochrysis_carterae.AAC.1